MAEQHGCGSKPMVPFWGRRTTNFLNLFCWGLGCSLGGTLWLLTHGHVLPLFDQDDELKEIASGESLSKHFISLAKEALRAGLHLPPIVLRVCCVIFPCWF